MTGRHRRDDDADAADGPGLPVTVDDERTAADQRSDADSEDTANPGNAWS